MNRFSKKALVWSLIAFLLVLRHDFWFWGDRTLVFGFVPLGLLWQASISAGAGLGWYLVVTHAWPDHIEDWASDRRDSLAGGQIARADGAHGAEVSS